jgi:hypothetical protein
MGHSIPVFYVPLEQDAIPKNLNDWHSAESILGDLWEKRLSVGLRQTVSRNSWHQDALGTICRNLGISGLEFINLEIAALDSEELKIAAKALDKVLEKIADGIPKLDALDEKNGSIWTVRHYNDGKKFRRISREKMKQAFGLAKASYDVDEGGALGFKTVVGFSSYIKTFRAAVDDALNQKKYLLIVQPQP